MHAIKVTDSTGLYIITLARIDPDYPSLHVTTCYHFQPGRTTGEVCPIHKLPYTARLIIAQVTREET